MASDSIHTAAAHRQLFHLVAHINAKGDQRRISEQELVFVIIYNDTANFGHVDRSCRSTHHYVHITARPACQ
ncbi:hypothetical protein PR001_g21798 [Phytophthora rubi]|uniref:Uncharacterized protein n=1 Tax=Phytophthora rubi TaxID=129364 RepID=A0A6A3JAW1_9STRA|nr:hypothetical protein PR001_g21798 [Phytophthora rubi]